MTGCTLRQIYLEPHQKKEEKKKALLLCSSTGKNESWQIKWHSYLSCEHKKWECIYIYIYIKIRVILAAEMLIFAMVTAYCVWISTFRARRVAFNFLQTEKRRFCRGSLFPKLPLCMDGTGWATRATPPWKVRLRWGVAVGEAAASAVSHSSTACQLSVHCVQGVFTSSCASPKIEPRQSQKRKFSLVIWVKMAPEINPLGLSQVSSWERARRKRLDRGVKTGKWIGQTVCLSCCPRSPTVSFRSSFNVKKAVEFW